MPNITMCKNIKCPLRDNCERYTAKPNEHRQSYGSFEFQQTEIGVTCEHFVNNERYDLGA